MAAGLGAATMLSIVTVLGLDQPFVGAGDSPPPTPPPDPTAVAMPPIQVVIHRTPAAHPVATGVGEAPIEATPTSEAPPPIVLSANPVVQTVTVTGPAQTRANPSTPARQQTTATPAATTSGSN